MLDIRLIVLPVFVIVGLGYLSSRIGLLRDSDIDVLLRFCTGIAIPCLLFSGVARLDLADNFKAGPLISFYGGGLVAFGLGYLGARKIFGRRPGEAVAVAFCALFSNSLLLGIPVTERAYGTEALSANFAILSIHAPFIYLVGIVAMEFARADGRPPLATAKAAARMMFRNSLTIGIAIGLAVNLTGLPLPDPVFEGVQTLGRGGIPVALFALGAAMTRYRLQDGLGEAAFAAGLSLLLHPLITFLAGHYGFGIEDRFLRSAVVTASMPPGINAYLFAVMYQRATGVSAATVLLATMFSVVTASWWLALLHAVAP